MKNTFLFLWICVKAFFKVQFNGKPGAGPMALIKFGQIIAEARGSLAGTVFSRNTAGSYMRQKVSPVQPRTPAQSLVRTLFTAVAQAWRGLSEANRLAWVTVAETFTNVNVFGDNVPLTGFGLHSKLNRNRQEIDEVLLTEPPAQTSVEGLTALSVVIDNAEPVQDDKIKIDFTPAFPVTQKSVLYATAPLSAGINFVQAEFRKIDVLIDADVSPLSIGDAYVAVFGEIPPVGTKAFVKLRPIVITAGISGTELRASDIAV